jgi:hypothetical protein
MKKTFFVLVLIVIWSVSMVQGSAEEEAVKKAIVDAYINGFFLKGNAVAIEKGFHRKCETVQFRYIDINKQPISYWIDHYKKYPGPSFKDAVYKFCSLTVSERIANAVVEVQASKEMIFTALLSLYKLKEGWKIVSNVVYQHGYQVPKEHKIAVVDPSVYDDFSGRYTTDNGLELIVTKSGNRLFVRDPLHPEMEFFPESETTFFSKFVESTITFARDKKGVVTRLILRSHKPGSSEKIEITARRIIPKVAVLSDKIKYFKMSEVAAGPFDSKESALKQYGKQFSRDLEIAAASPKGMVKGWFLVKSKPIVSTKDLESVSRGRDPRGNPAVSVLFKSESAENLRVYTTANQGKRLAIMLDNQVISAPVIGGVISKASIISGHFSIDEVNELILQLKLAINKN